MKNLFAASSDFTNRQIVNWQKFNNLANTKSLVSNQLTMCIHDMAAHLSCGSHVHYKFKDAIKTINLWIAF